MLDCDFRGRRLIWKALESIAAILIDILVAIASNITLPTTPRTGTEQHIHKVIRRMVRVNTPCCCVILTY
jgi:hypothetical protein